MPLKTACSILLAVSICFLSWTKAGEVTIDVTPVGQTIKILRVNSKIGNTNSVLIHANQQAVLIDPNFNHSGEQLRQSIAQLGVSAIQWLSISHTHQDHTEQIPEFMNDQPTLILSQQQHQQLLADQLVTAQDKVQIVEQNYLLNLSDIAVQVVPLPQKIAHTTGDLVFWVDSEKTLIVGDYLFTHGYPIIDKQIGNINGYFKNLDYLVNQFARAEHVIAGHSSISPAAQWVMNFSEFAQRIDLLKTSVCKISQSKRQGISVEQAIETGLGKIYEKLNQDAVFINEARWIKYLYQQEIDICQ